MKLKPKHRLIASHYARWVDKNWFPDFVLTDDVIRAFIKNESYGPTSLSQEERLSISALIGESSFEAAIPHTLTGKPSYELQKQMIHEEILFYWSRGFGWAPPLEGLIGDEYRDRHSIKNTTYIKELINLYRKIREMGLINYMYSVTDKLINKKQLNQAINIYFQHYVHQTTKICA